MASSSILRRVASSVSPLTIIRAVGSRAQNIKALNVHGHDRRIPFSTRYYCSASKSPSCEEENLLSIINSKINQENTTDIVKEIPGLPYVIHYSPKEYHQLRLKREYKNEEVVITISTYDLELGKDLIPLTLAIIKANKSCLLFRIHAFPHEIQLVDFTIISVYSDGLNKVERPTISNVDENLKNALLKYIEVRQIDHITINALRKHMSRKMDSLSWLKNLKGYVEK